MRSLGLRLRLDAARSTPPTPSTTAGTSGSSSRCWSGAGLPPLLQGELVHRLPHRHRQRAGEGRPLRALRLAGGGREMPEWAFRITRYSRGAAGRRWTPQRVARAHHPHAAQLDRPSEGAEADFAVEGGDGADPRLHHPHRHHLRLHLRGARAGPPAGGRASPRRSARPRWRPSPRGWRRSARPSGPREGAREGRRRSPARYAHQPVHRPAGPGLGRQLRARRLRHRRGDERARARRARLRVRPEVRPADQGGDPAGRRARRSARRAAGGGVHRGRRAGRLGRVHRPAPPRRRARQMAARLEQRGHRQADGHLPPEGLGLLAASATGARPSPSSTARSATRSARASRCPDEQLPVRLPDIDIQAVLTGKGEPPLAKVPSLVEHHLPEAAAARRGARRRRWTPSSTPPGTTRATSRRTTTSAPFDAEEAKRWLPGGHLRGRPRARGDAPALLPLLDAGDEGAGAGRRSTSR